MYELYLKRRSGGKKVIRFKAPNVEMAGDYAESFMGKEDFISVKLVNLSAK